MAARAESLNDGLQSVEADNNVDFLAANEIYSKTSPFQPHQQKSFNSTNNSGATKLSSSSQCKMIENGASLIYNP